ncbi:creatininase family protein [Streptomyces malaysiensis subsp. malaysiensis]|uniref:creatininase family protein n=1 Tax=Streptomyces malaysiensis TaxID=92644 RepID=UPI000BFDBB00|nr:creatininase family protein [Streptomyces malaysiensis]QDL68716.1 creatininase family protein [Streptomyces malaysiensis]
MRRLCHGRNRGGSTTLPHLTELTWREARTAGADAIALMPIGSQEQHGAHLPMGTDTLLVTAVVDRAAELLAGDGPPVVRLPALPYGHSPHHLFAAAVSLSASTLTAVLADVLRSLTESGFRRIMIVNGHGGNDEIMRLAVKEHALRAEGAFAACSYWSLGEAPENPGHAGRYETSLMLAAHPDLVRTPIEPHTPAGAPPLFAVPPRPGLTAERHGEWARVGGMTDDPSAARPDPGGLTIRATELARAIRAFAEATAPGSI